MKVPRIKITGEINIARVTSQILADIVLYPLAVTRKCVRVKTKQDKHKLEVVLTTTLPRVQFSNGLWLFRDDNGIRLPDGRYSGAALCCRVSHGNSFHLMIDILGNVPCISLVEGACPTAIKAYYKK